MILKEEKTLAAKEKQLTKLFLHMLAFQNILAPPPPPRLLRIIWANMYA